MSLFNVSPKMPEGLTVAVPTTLRQHTLSLRQHGKPLEGSAPATMGGSIQVQERALLASSSRVSYFRDRSSSSRGLFKEAERRGYSIDPTEKRVGEGAGVGITIKNHLVGIRITEILDRLPLSEEDLAAWRKNNEWRLKWNERLKPPKTKGRPSGRLRITLPSEWNGSRHNWSEGRRGPLEGKLGSVLAEIERRADEWQKLRAMWAEQEEERRRLAELRREAERIERIEQARAERLKAQVSLWRLTGEVREFAQALRRRVEELTLEPQECERLVAWAEWAERWAAGSDPLRYPERLITFEDERDRLGVPPWLG